MRTYLFFILACSASGVEAQTFTEKTSKELVFETPSTNNTLMLANIHGNVKITEYEGAGVLVELVKTIDAKTEERLETGKQEVQMGVIDRVDTLIIYVRDGCHRFQKNAGRHSGNSAGWGYHSEGGGDCMGNLTYNFKLDFTVRVPAGVHVVASTINNGNVVVENVTGTVNAANINGSITLSNLKGQAEAKTINGNVDIDYANNPPEGCRFYTLNGDINAVFRPGLSANVSFQSFNGDLFTNMDGIEALPARVETFEQGEGLRYRISGNQFKVRNGGPLLDFETFNGNVYLKEE